MNMNEWIDISTILADLVQISITIHDSIELDKMNLNVENLIISSNNCNELISLNLNEYRYLKSIEIGDECFKNVDLFSIDGLNELKSLKIGINSFTKYKDSYAYNEFRSFSFLNCDKLETIEIGPYSFSDYGGGFELKNLPKLSTIKIGKIGEIWSSSSNFYFSSFVIKGIIDMISLMNRSSTFEFCWVGQWYILSFLINNNIKYLNDLNEWIIDLPHLISINLGKFALAGSGSSCSLLMESNIDLNELIFRSS